MVTFVDLFLFPSKATMFFTLKRNSIVQETNMSSFATTKHSEISDLYYSSKNYREFLECSFLRQLMCRKADRVANTSLSKISLSNVFPSL